LELSYQSQTSAVPPQGKSLCFPGFLPTRFEQDLRSNILTSVNMDFFFVSTRD
jgi:hypothetical protein